MGATNSVDGQGRPLKMNTRSNELLNDNPLKQNTSTKKSPEQHSTWVLIFFNCELMKL